MATTIKDDDLFVVFDMPPGEVRRKASRLQWATLKMALMDAMGAFDLTKLDAKVTQEIADRKAADTTIQASVTKEITDRQTAISQADANTTAQITTEATTRANQDTLEAQARTASDTALSGRITALETSQVVFETISGVTGSGTTTPVAFSKTYQNPPTMIPLPTWSGQQIVESTASGITKTGANVSVKRSRATLLLSAGPFEDAPAGTAFAFFVVGR